MISSQAMARITDFAEGIRSRPPSAMAQMDPASWFVTEEMEVQVGESVGRPSGEVQLSREYVAYLLSAGWVISAFSASAEGGAWESAATTTVESSSGSASSGRSEAESAPSGEKEVVSARRIDGTVETRVVQTPSRSEVETSGAANSSGRSVTSVSGGGAPYWYAWCRVRLTRRRIRAEYVLRDMVASFTSAYNEGREINSERYDELVACYLLLVQQTDERADAFAGIDASDFRPLADMVTDAVRNAVSEYRSAADGIPADWLRSREDDVNRRFDALAEQARQEMISKGTYNSTVWPSVLSGIERDRQAALTALGDQIVSLRLDARGRIATVTADVGQKLLDCGIRIVEARRQLLLGPLELRNTVVKWMLDFMERRDDEYPSLDTLVTVADRLGYADGVAQGG